MASMPRSLNGTIAKLLLALVSLVLLSAAVWALRTDPKVRDRTILMFTSIKVGQVIELMSGVGELGTLADGSGAPTILLKEGIAVETVRGTQPLVARPLPPLPMDDHPHLLDEYASGGVHADSYNSSVSPLPGPLGLKPTTTAVTVLDDEIAMCTPLMREHKGRLASICISLGGPSQLVLFDPEDDFKILAQTAIPKRRSLIDPAGGWYTRMDQKGRPIVPTPGQDIRVYGVSDQGETITWEIEEQWDLSTALPTDVSASDVVPDWAGNFWFISGFGHVGYLNRETGNAKVIELGGGTETIGAALSVSKHGAYVLTSKAVYLMQPAEDGTPKPVWRWDYGQAGGVDLSSPTIFDNSDLVAFSIDGRGDRSQIVVLKAGPQQMLPEERSVCEFPVFEAGKSSIKNTVVGYGRSIVAQNNWGAEFFEIADYEPGLVRVDVREDHSGCDVVWEDTTIASQVPPRLSTGDGHVYLYSRKRGTDDDVHVWYLTALDFQTGAVISELFVGSGKRIDSPMLSVNFLPGHVAVVGVRNGLIALSDG